MRFSDGYWRPAPGTNVQYPQSVYRTVATDRSVTAYAPLRAINNRRNTLNNPLLTVVAWSPQPGIIGIRTTHHSGGPDRKPRFELNTRDDHAVTVDIGTDAATLTTGDLSVTLGTSGAWNLTFNSEGKLLTSTDSKSLGYATGADGRHYLHERLTIDVGETLYGFGERATAFVKNGQSVETWNSDGGPSSDHAYKSVPFYISSKGYGVFVNSPDRVSFEVGSEFSSRTQFSVPGQELEYFVIGGGSPKEVLSRYTALTGKAPVPPPWSFGLWLSTSFVTTYDENTVMHFVDGMKDRDIPMSVFHFDSFWMKEFQWCDFEWNRDAFPDPEGMLERLKAKGLKTSVWINPYVAQQSAVFDEGKAKGYFVRRADGGVWQWDTWQAGMAIVDFTNPEACEWFSGKLRHLLDMGVDCFKTDFGEQAPLDGVFHDGSDPSAAHNYYSYLYNKTVFETITEMKGSGEAVLFARSATAGGQQFPVHWGGDPEPTYVSMAESLRAGLSLGLSGFAFWSHDIGGFEGNPTPELFMRWAAFGLLSSHSRLHGSTTYRVPWEFGDTATEVVRSFVKLKMKLMPYIYGAAKEAESGLPLMRAMMLEFPEDLNCRSLDRQYMLGSNLLVAPVFSDAGEVSYYVPAGVWTNFFTGETVTGPAWIEEVHGLDSVPLLVRPGTVIPVGSVDTAPDYDYRSDVTLEIYQPAEGFTDIRVPSGGADEAGAFAITRKGKRLTLEARTPLNWRVLLVNNSKAQLLTSGRIENTPRGALVTPDLGAKAIQIEL
ncbi:Alpha-xylosidase [Arthrobacter sp. 9AX]|uniref:alpha-xylosidase n=1 Tax=Arthrobacter sp. 9AX TaxID=2653131 RepID=UPI0012F305C5|nr:alpha-xylosidase [Arthrobacter sp. 9AX]VXC14361.1 Alpha-xylosidase [Arthrobacter sp. 9AX]